MASKKRKLVWILLTAIAGCFIYVALAPKGIAQWPSPPNPNGYDDFLAATNSLSKAVDPVRQYTTEELRTIVMANEEAVKRVLVGLGRECRVPIALTMDYLMISQQHASALRRISPALVARGRLAEKEDRLSDARTAYLAAIQFGHEMRRGGLISDSLVGFACEAQGHNAISPLLSRFDRNQLKLITDTLETLESKREPWSDVVNREKRFMRTMAGLWEYTASRFMLMISGQYKLVAQKAKQAEAHCHLLLLNAAIRRHRLENGNYPSELTGLVPKTLNRLPTDPFSNRPYVYRVTGEGFLLYSVGLDGRDNGGQAGDLLSESRW